MSPKPHKFILKGFQPKHFAVVAPKTVKTIEESKPKPTVATLTGLTPTIISALTTAPKSTPARATPATIRRDMPTGRVTTMVKVADMRLIRPDLAKFISKVHFRETGVPRDKIKVPISPVKDVSDEILFEGASDATNKYYLPRYRIAEKNVSGQQQFQVSLKQKEQGGNLSVLLEKYPAGKLGEGSRGAQEIDHAVNIKLKFRLNIGDSGGVETDLDFQEYAEEEGAVRATLNVARLTEFTQIFQAITNMDFEATLIVRRVMRVAIPIDKKPQVEELNRKIINLQKQVNALTKKELSLKQQLERIQATKLNKIQADIKKTNNQLTGRRTHLAKKQQQLILKKKALQSTNPFMRHVIVGQIRQLENEVNRLKQEIKAIELRKNALANKLNKIRSRIPQIQRSVTKTKNDSAKTNKQLERTRKRLNEVQAVPFYRETTRTLDHVVEPRPFVFPPALHPYVTQDVTKASAQKFGLIWHQVEWNSNYYSYFQNQAKSNLFYYLPDSFKIARRPEVPHHPIMSVQFTQTDGSVENMQAMFEYVAIPFVNPVRLETAGVELSQNIDESSEENELEFEPLRGVDPDKVKFTLALPRSDSSAGPFEERSGAMVSLEGIQDLLSLSVKDFQTIYDAIFGGSAVLLQGKVEIDLGINEKKEMIPLIVQMDDLAGELFTYKEVPDEETGEIKVTVRNEIESPVEIINLIAVIRRDGKEFPAECKDLNMPVILQPGDEANFTVSPSVSLSGEGPISAFFDLDDVKVRPDPENVWNVIFDPLVSAQPVRKIAVQTVPQIFEPRGESDSIVAIDVIFESGEIVEFTSQDCPEEKQICKIQTEIQLPLSGYILRKVSEGEYHYRVTVIRANGKSEGDEDPWEPSKVDVLWIDTSKLPSEES